MIQLTNDKPMTHGKYEGLALFSVFAGLIIIPVLFDRIISIF